MLWLEKVATTAGAFNVFVQLREKNSGAFALYEYLGYGKLDVLPRFYKGIENGVVMAKSLRTMINATLTSACSRTCKPLRAHFAADARR